MPTQPENEKTRLSRMHDVACSCFHRQLTRCDSEQDLAWELHIAVQPGVLVVLLLGVCSRGQWNFVGVLVFVLCYCRRAPAWQQSLARVECVGRIGQCLWWWWHRGVVVFWVEGKGGRVGSGSGRSISVAVVSAVVVSSQ